MALGLTPGSMRSIIRAAIPRLVAQGLGSNAIINELRGQGLALRRTEFLKEIRRVTGLARLENTVKRVAGDVMFPSFAMIDSDYRAARRYYVQARMTLLDEESGEEFERWVSFYSNTRMTKDQWTEAFVRGYAEGRYGDYEQILDVEIASVEHKAGWAY